MKNKDITIFIGSLAGGGAERVACNLANFLFESENNVTILTMSDIEDTYEVNSKIKRVYLLKKNERRNKILDFFKRFKKLSKYMSNNKTDVYIVMLPITTIMMLLLRKKTDAKIIMSERVDPNSYNLVKKVLLKLLARRADGYVFQTDDAKKWYNLKNEKSIVIPNAINEVFLKQTNQTVIRKKKIVSVGRLNKQKNFELLIKSFLNMDNKYSDYKLYIYGEGKEKNKLLNIIRKNNLEGRVLLPGYSKNIKEDIKDASLFVMSSNFEGMPNALIEAMALGLPCISTDCPCGGPKYLIKNNINGILVPVGNENYMTKKIEFLLSNETISKKIGDNAKKVVDDLHPNKIYNTWLNFIYSVID